MPSHSDSPSPRARDIYATVNGLAHIFIGDAQADAERGISPDEHHRRHFAYYAGFMSALEYMIEYPHQAAKLVTEYRKLLAPEHSRMATDQVMGEITEALYPQPPITDTANRILDIAAKYEGAPRNDTENVRPVIDNGRLVWENVEPNKRPFPSWDEEYEQWRHVD